MTVMATEEPRSGDPSRAGQRGSLEARWVIRHQVDSGEITRLLEKAFDARLNTTQRRRVAEIFDLPPAAEKSIIYGRVLDKSHAIMLRKDDCRLAQITVTATGRSIYEVVQSVSDCVMSALREGSPKYVQDILVVDRFGQPVASGGYSRTKALKDVPRATAALVALLCTILVLSGVVEFPSQIGVLIAGVVSIGYIVQQVISKSIDWRFPER
jgi:hypothetical protein